MGLRVLPNLLKVYHLPLNMMVSGTSWCDFFTLSMPILRHLYIRENIDIVHGHQATSVLCLHSTLVAQYMGIKTVFTDHSLFGFNDIASFYLNKMLKFHLAHIDACICVSHANKDNLTLRAAVDPSKIYVIPNSVDTLQFTPNPGLRYPVNMINIVVICRLTFRKGVDLLVDVIPVIL